MGAQIRTGRDAAGALALAGCLFILGLGAGCKEDSGGDRESRDDKRERRERRERRGELLELDRDLAWVREMAPGGALVYSADKVVRVVELSDGSITELGSGLMPEFSPDGSKVAWVRASGLMVANRDGTQVRSLYGSLMKHGGAHWIDNESLVAVRDDGGKYQWNRFWIDGRREPIAELNEFGINPDRARETDVRHSPDDDVWTHVAYQSWKTSDGGSGKIDGGCAPSISPDGRSITALQGSHTELKIRPVREGGITHDLVWRYRGKFDNHRWSSNDARFLVAVEETSKTMVLIEWRSGRAVAFGEPDHEDNTRMYGDFTQSDRHSGVAMPPLLPEAGRETAATPGSVPAERGDPVELPEWPLRTEGMVFMFDVRGASNEWREFANDPPRQAGGMLRGRATYDRFGAWALTGGRYEVPEATGGEWAARVRERGGFAIEFVAREVAASGEGRVADLGAMRILQKGGALHAAIGDREFELGPIAESVPQHWVVTFGGGALASYIDGEEGAVIPVDGELPDGDPTGFVFGGDGWRGILEAVAVFARTVDAEEAGHRAAAARSRFAPRQAAPRAVVKATLKHYTPPIPLAAMDSYRRCLTEHVFEVQEVIEGEIGAGSVRVLDWATLDMQILPERWKGKEGQDFELVLEPVEAHSDLEKLERIERYEGLDAFDMEGFVLVELR